MPISNQIGASSLIKPGVIDSAATRPASPFEGQVIFQKDTDQILVWSGTAWVCTSALAGLQIDSSGRVTTPQRPFFFARGGNGTYTSGVIPYTTETYDIGNNYNASTSTFTAPVSGLYQFNAQFFAIPSLAGGADFIAGGQSFRYGREFADTSYEGYAISVSYYLTASQTAYLQWFTGTVHVAATLSFFSGYLVG
jgi:hypothetical protein